MRRNISPSDIVIKNRIYDHAANGAWRLVVYEPVHEGWAFTNIGGMKFLDYMGHRAYLAPNSTVLELCSGLGDTCLYIANRFGSSVTGLDVNARQVRTARRRLRSVAIGGRPVRFIRADVQTWKPDSLFDLVYSLDSLVLVPRVLDVFRTAYASLK